MNRAKRINILLIMPKVDISYQDWPVPPVGIAYISAALKKKNFHVFQMNLNLEQEDYCNALRDCIEKNEINVVGTGGLIVNYHAIKRIINMVKKIDNSIITWVGGSLITFSAIPVMDGIKNIDIGMLGEGEITACEMARTLQETFDIDEIAGMKGTIVRKNDGTIVLGGEREEIVDIDEIPIPDYDGFQYFEMIKKFWASEETGIISAPLTTSRSCPFSCTFCSKSGGTKYRQRSLKSIFFELEYLIDKYKVNRILLNDELFANDYTRIEDFCKRIKIYPQNIKWFVSLRVSKNITKELLELMKESGCVQILYGLESGDNDVLKSMRKGITSEEIERVVKITAETGFQVRGNFIFGDTIETLTTANNTLKFVEKNLQYFASVAFSPIILFPGSFLYKKAVADNKIKNELDFIEKECPIMNVSKMTDEEYLYMINVLLPTAKIKQMSILNKKRVYDFKIDKNRNMYCFKKRCDKCNSENLYYIGPTEVIMRNNQYICVECGETMIFDVLQEFAIVFEETLSKICDRYHIAFWGVGQNLYILNELMNKMNEKNYILIDTNFMKVGTVGINDKLIYSPDDILDKGIDYIIETTSGKHFEIINRITKDYPQIEKKYSIFEVCIAEFDDN